MERKMPGDDTRVIFTEGLLNRMNPRKIGLQFFSELCAKVIAVGSGDPLGEGFDVSGNQAR
jgi:hypothetical protein